MERYWCLRWLMQEAPPTLTASVLKESLVRVDGIPLVLRVPSLPALDAGARVTLKIESIDLLAVEARARFVELLGSGGPDAALEDDSSSE